MKIGLLFFFMLSLTVLGQSGNSSPAIKDSVSQINYQQLADAFSMPCDSVFGYISSDTLIDNKQAYYDTSLERLGIFGDVIEFIGETMPSFALGLGILGQVLISLAW